VPQFNFCESFIGRTKVYEASTFETDLIIEIETESKNISVQFAIYNDYKY